MMTWEICKYLISILYFVFCLALIITTKKKKKMKKFIILMSLISSNAFAFDTEHSFKCDYVGDKIKRCENKEVFCYIYDSGWAGFTKSGRGAGISCIKK